LAPAGPANVASKGQLTKITDPAAKAEGRARFVDEYRDNFANPYKAASLGYIDEIIRPRETRGALIRSLKLLANKRQTNPPRKHGNIPL